MSITAVLTWFFVFGAMTLGDFCWAKYTQSVAKKTRLVAAGWSAAIVLCGSLVVMSYTENHFLLTAAIAGAFCGTYLALGEKKDESEDSSGKS
jgi:peptidoglycan/LPS O-acetylase OafA/YrhL